MAEAQDEWVSGLEEAMGWGGGAIGLCDEDFLLAPASGHGEEALNIEAAEQGLRRGVFIGAGPPVSQTEDGRAAMVTGSGGWLVGRAGKGGFYDAAGLHDGDFLLTPAGMENEEALNVTSRRPGKRLRRPLAALEGQAGGRRLRRWRSRLRETSGS